MTGKVIKPPLLYTIDSKILQFAWSRAYVYEPWRETNVLKNADIIMIVKNWQEAKKLFV